MQPAKDHSSSSEPWDLDEGVLIEQVWAGDWEAVESLYNHYSRVAFGLAYKMLGDYGAAEDAVQEAFLRFWKKPTNYIPANGRFVSWLLAVVRNVCLDYLQRAARYQEVISLDQVAQYKQTWPVQGAAFSTTVEGEVWLNLQREVIGEALAQLPAKHTELIETAFFKGLTHSQIANQTGLPLGTVKSRIRLGLLELRANQQIAALQTTY